MNCPTCKSGILVKKTKKIKAKGSSSCLFELIGVLLCLTIVGAIIGIPVLMLGHNAAYQKEQYYRCRNCGATFPASIE